MNRVKLWALLGALVAAAGATVWWMQQRAAPVAAAPGGGASGPGGAPVSVTLAAAERRDWPVHLSASGTVVALNTVDIRPQVASVVTRVAIREGQFVKAGELLFTLDGRADEANLAKAQAQLARDQAALADALRQLARSRELLEQKFISQSALDTNLTLVDSARAVVAADRAAVAAAQVVASHSRIVAPTAGRAGAIAVHAGSYVQPSGAALVTITQLDPIAVAFTLPQRELPDLLAALARGDAPVHAELPDGRGSLAGQLRFVDNEVDPNSGTVKVKAQFDNRELRLWPGAFVNVALTVRTIAGAVVIPQAAIIQGATDRTVFVAGADGRAAQRRVEVRDAAGGEAVVTGLEPGTQVVVEGRQNLHPGSPLRERSLAAAAAPASGPKPAP